MKSMLVLLLVSMGSLDDQWEAGPPAYRSGEPQLNPSVTIDDDVVTLRNRGILVSRRTASIVDLSFDWIWTQGEEAWNYHDHLCVVICTDGKQRPWACEIEQGIVVRFNPGSGGVSVEDFEKGKDDAVAIAQANGLKFNRGAQYRIRVVQKGRILKVAVDGSTIVTATLPRDVRGKVAIYNRESVAGVPKESRLRGLSLAGSMDEE